MQNRDFLIKKKKSLMGHKNGLVHFMNKTVVLNENQNFIGTMDFASEKGIGDVQRLSES